MSNRGVAGWASTSRPQTPRVRSLLMADSRSDDRPGPGSPRTGSLPEPETALEWLSAMLLVRRFEERAGESYARAKIGGFLHLAIGEEATIVGAVRAIRPTDYLISTYRSHGHALVARHPAERRDGRAVRPRRRVHHMAAAARCTSSTSSDASWAATGSSAATSRSPPALPSPPTTRATARRRSACSATAPPTRAPSARR